MRRTYEFIFFALYAMVPKKSIYGQKNAAVVLISLVDCAVATSIYFLTGIFFRDIGKKPILLIIIGTIVIVSFVFNSRYFGNRKNFKEILAVYEPSDLSHRLMGAGILLATFIVYVSIVIYGDRYIHAHP